MHCVSSVGKPSGMWLQLAEQIVSRLIAGLPPDQLDPARTHAARLGALPIAASMWADYYLHPSGAVIVVGEDIDQPESDSVYTDRISVLKVLVWGARRYPELATLLPVRGSGAVDCPTCPSHPFFGAGRVLCPTCGGLGWLPACDS